MSKSIELPSKSAKQEATHNQCAAKMRNMEDDSVQILNPGITVKHLVDQGLSQELGIILQEDMGITTLTAVQAAIIYKCLEHMRDANGFPKFPSFHVSTGVGSGKTLAQAIAIVDYLIKFRNAVADLTVPADGPDREARRQAAKSSAFNTGTIHVLILCQTVRQVGHVCTIYRTLCSKLDIKVARSASYCRGQLLKSIVNNIQTSRATITICILDRFFDIIANMSPRHGLAGTIVDHGYRKSSQFSDLEESAVLQFGKDIKAVVLEDTLEYAYKSWTSILNSFTDMVLSHIDAMCPRVVISMRNLDRDPHKFSYGGRQRVYPKRYYEIKDSRVLVHGDISWSVHPYIARPKYLREHDEALSVEQINQKAQELLEQNTSTPSKRRIILVAGRDSFAEEAYALQCRRIPGLDKNAVVLISTMDHESIAQGLQSFNSGRKSVIFTTAGMIWDLEMVDVDMVIFMHWPPEEEYIADDTLDITRCFLENTILAGKMGARGTIHMLFDCDLEYGIQHPELGAIFEIYDTLCRYPFTCGKERFVDAFKSLVQRAELIGVKFPFHWDRILGVIGEELGWSEDNWANSHVDFSTTSDDEPLYDPAASENDSDL